MRYQVVNVIAAAWDDSKNKHKRRRDGPNWVFIIFIVLFVFFLLTHGVPTAIIWALNA